MTKAAHSPVEISGPLTKAFSRAYAQEQQRLAELQRIDAENQKLIVAGRVGLCAQLAISIVGAKKGGYIPLSSRGPDQSSSESILGSLSPQERVIALDLLPWMQQSLGEGPAIALETPRGETA